MSRLLISPEARLAYERASVRVGRVCAAMRISPNAITLASVLVAAACCAALGTGHLGAGLILGLAASGLDALDGSTARALSLQNALGTVLDRTADRTVEALFVLGLMLGGYVSPVLALVGLFSMFLPSYVRAVAEASGAARDCERGWAGRLEKLVVLAFGVVVEILFPGSRAIHWALVVVVGLSLTTAVQRLAYLGSRRG